VIARARPTLKYALSGGSAILAVLMATCGGDSGVSGDHTPPAAVQSLGVVETTDSSVTLTWVAPGDDGAEGTAAEYDLRYATKSLTEANWGTATRVPGEPTPHPAGTIESLTVTGFLPDTTYYLAIKTCDSDSNWSALSNVVSAKVNLFTITIDEFPTGINSVWYYATAYRTTGPDLQDSTFDTLAAVVDASWQGEGDTTWGWWDYYSYLTHGRVYRMYVVQSRNKLHFRSSDEPWQRWQMWAFALGDIPFPLQDRRPWRSYVSSFPYGNSSVIPLGHTLVSVPAEGGTPLEALHFRQDFDATDEHVEYWFVANIGLVKLRLQANYQQEVRTESWDLIEYSLP